MSSTPELNAVIAILDEVMPLLRSLPHGTYEMAYAQALLSERREYYGLHSNDARRIDLAKKLAAIGLGRYGSGIARFGPPRA